MTDSQKDSMLPYTDVEDIPDIVSTLRSSFKAGKAREVSFRVRQLQLLAYLLHEHKDAFVQTLRQDLGRSPMNALLLEINGCIREVVSMAQNLKSYAKPDYVSADPPFNLARPHVAKCPRGVVLIVAPFNYPLMLLIWPLAGAIAAGNTIVMKPSETAVHTNALLTRLMPLYLDQSCYRIVNGAIDQSTALLREKWDFIFYTGGGFVGKIVAKAAAEHLTPVALELGGQCPAIVDETADLDLAAKRICWGRNINAGQTCVATNHVLVVERVHEAFVKAVQKYYKKFFYDTGIEEQCKIISPAHHQRLAKTLAATSGSVVLGGKSNTSMPEGYFQPTIVDHVTMDDALMQDELFGPILPIISVANVSEAIQHVNSRGRPLAIYLFSKSKAVRQQVMAETQSGALNVNDCVTQMTIPTLGFRGVGESGHGGYMGKRTFDLFSYERAVMAVPGYLEPLLETRYPPVTPFKVKMYEWVLQAKVPFKKPKLDGTEPTRMGGPSIATTAIMAVSFVAAVAATVL